MLSMGGPPLNCLHAQIFIPRCGSSTHTHGVIKAFDFAPISRLSFSLPHINPWPLRARHIYAASGVPVALRVAARTTWALRLERTLQNGRIFGRRRRPRYFSKAIFVPSSSGAARAYYSCLLLVPSLTVQLGIYLLSCTPCWSCLPPYHTAVQTRPSNPHLMVAHASVVH